MPGSYLFNSLSGTQTGANEVVADWSALQAAGPADPNKIYYCIDASGDPTVDSGAAWYQWDSLTVDWIKLSEQESIDLPTATDSVQGLSRRATSAEIQAASDVTAFLNPSEVNTMINLYGLKIVSTDHDNIDSLLEDLETNYPAVDNDAKLAFVKGSDGRAGLYVSDDDYWRPLLESPGLRSDLYFYEGKLTYDSVDEVGSSSSTASHLDISGATLTDLSGAELTAANNAFDENDTTDTTGLFNSGSGNDVLVMPILSAKKLGKHRIKLNGVQSADKVRFYGITSRSPLVYQELFPDSIIQQDAGAPITFDANRRLTINSTAEIDVTIALDHPEKTFSEFGIAHDTTLPSDGMKLKTWGAWENIDNTDGVNCVGAINDLNSRLAAVAEVTVVDVADIAARDALIPDHDDTVRVLDAGSGVTKIYRYNADVPGWLDVTSSNAAYLSLVAAQDAQETADTADSKADSNSADITALQSDMADRLVKSNNLSDVTNAATARSNLGVNTQAENDARYLLESNNLSDLDNAATARANLSVNTQSENDARYLLESNNLSDLDNAATARANLDVYSQGEVDTAIDDALDGTKGKISFDVSTSATISIISNKILLCSMTGDSNDTAMTAGMGTLIIDTSDDTFVAPQVSGTVGGGYTNVGFCADSDSLAVRVKKNGSNYEFIALADGSGMTGYVSYVYL